MTLLRHCNSNLIIRQSDHHRPYLTLDAIWCTAKRCHSQGSLCCRNCGPGVKLGPSWTCPESGDIARSIRCVSWGGAHIALSTMVQAKRELLGYEAFCKASRLCELIQISTPLTRGGVRVEFLAKADPNCSDLRPCINPRSSRDGTELELED